MEKILIVDDRKNVRISLSIGLGRVGYSADVASNAQEALLKLQSKKFDLVLTDVKMPDVNGFILGSVIKKLYPEIKLILMSAYDFKEFNDKFRFFDNCPKLSKPFEMNELLTILKMQFNTNKTQIHC